MSAPEPPLRLWAVEVTQTKRQTVYVVASDESDALSIAIAQEWNIDWYGPEGETEVNEASPVESVTDVDDNTLDEEPLHDLDYDDDRAEWTCADWLDGFESHAEDLARRTDTATQPLPLRYDDGREERITKVVHAPEGGR